ncbi:spaetzle domain-containing protein 4 [Oratosquilla oratoria]|uniref:spaetzle domain-containing protein 4 n=1 Tax=Oratosquilla oratoria TaxID=337810 RepID=UPI003F7732F8
MCACVCMGFDEFMSCGSNREERNFGGFGWPTTAEDRRRVPCDLSSEDFCNQAGSQYPWRAARRFMYENQALMKRMYGDQRQITILRNEIVGDMDDPLYPAVHRYKPPPPTSSSRHHKMARNGGSRRGGSREGKVSGKATPSRGGSPGGASVKRQRPRNDRAMKVVEAEESSEAKKKSTETSSSSSATKKTTAVPTARASAASATSGKQTKPKTNNQNTYSKGSTSSTTTTKRTRTRVTATSTASNPSMTKITKEEDMDKRTSDTTSLTSASDQTTEADDDVGQTNADPSEDGEGESTVATEESAQRSVTGKEEEEEEEEKEETTLITSSTETDDPATETVAMTPSTSRPDFEKIEAREEHEATLESPVKEDLVVLEAEERINRPEVKYKLSENGKQEAPGREPPREATGEATVSEGSSKDKNPMGTPEVNKPTTGQGTQVGGSEPEEVSEGNTVSSNFVPIRGVNACPVKSEVVAPYWAKNIKGQMLALLNIYPFEQYVRYEKCTHEFQQMYCRRGCRCEQQYRLLRLLAIDPNNNCRGIFSDWFRFPSCCVCKCYDLPRDVLIGADRRPRHHVYAEDMDDYDDEEEYEEDDDFYEEDYDEYLSEEEEEEEREGLEVLEGEAVELTAEEEEEEEEEGGRKGLDSIKRRIDVGVENEEDIKEEEEEEEEKPRATMTRPPEAQKVRYISRQYPPRRPNRPISLAPHPPPPPPPPPPPQHRLPNLRSLPIHRMAPPRYSPPQPFPHARYLTAAAAARVRSIHEAVALANRLPANNMFPVTTAAPVRNSTVGTVNQATPYFFHNRTERLFLGRAMQRPLPLSRIPREVPVEGRDSRRSPGEGEEEGEGEGTP